jgi:hypothetical protein
MATLFLILAIVLLGCCAFGVENVRGIHLGWMGLMVYVAIGLLHLI